jgi:hypothetical protein
MTYLHRLNSLGTFTGTVLAAVCLAVTATGECEWHQYRVRLLQV